MFGEGGSRAKRPSLRRGRRPQTRHMRRLFGLSRSVPARTLFSQRSRLNYKITSVTNVLV